MKTGTRFKLECEANYGQPVICLGNGKKATIYLRGERIATLDELKDSISDIRPSKKPREKVTLPNGRVLYRVRDDEPVRVGDYFMREGSTWVEQALSYGQKAGRNTHTYLSESDGTEDT